MAPAPSYPLRSAEPNPLHFRNLTLNRLDQLEGGEYKNLTNVLYETRLDTEEYITIEKWSSPGLTKVPFDEAIKQKFAPSHKGIKMGPSWSQHWFRVTIKLPAEFADKERVQLEWDPSAEATIFNTEGLALLGITGGFGGDRKVDFILDPTKRASVYKFYIEVSCNGMFGVIDGERTDAPSNANRTYKLNSADIVVPRMEAWRLLWDFRLLKDLARSLPERSPLGNQAFEAANKILNVFRADDLKTIASSRSIAEGVFGKGWEKEGAAVYDEAPAHACNAWGIGNCHIDTAWLWPYSATMQKTARSWSTQLDLMNRYPEHRFVASQAQQFKWLEQQHPLLFDAIKAKVAEGNFQVIGGTWVESDTNMPSGEALCRQFLFGQRYFKSRFGEYCRVFWLPDSFGYSSQIPQIARLSGTEFFFTQKLSWSQFNEFPHTTFRWVGQDGTQVLTHMTPINTYTGQATLGEVRNTVLNHKSLQSGASTGLLTFGNGDGGGGPLAPMLENLRRCRAVANKTPEIPKVVMGPSVDDFFDDILAKTEDGKTLPTWDGELYLELHRGTATSHGWIKRGNRKSEILLHDIEYLATLASLVPGTSYKYPKDALDALWEPALLNQFHDVLPGSAIEMVYEDAQALYDTIAKDGAVLLHDAIEALEPEPSKRDSSSPVVAVNTEPFPRRELIEVPLESVKALGNHAVQLSFDGKAALALFEDLDGSGAVAPAPFSTLDKVPSASARKVGSTFLLANSSLEVTLSKEGRFTSIVDLELDRELLDTSKDPAGFVLYEDRPIQWDAWDVDAFLLESKTLVNATSAKVVADGPLRAAVEVTYAVGEKSIIKATISIDSLTHPGDALGAIRFDVEVDWHEQHQMLKYELPLDIRSDFATYENQFGWVSRPTVRNTTWDRAKFEVVGHKFADLSEFGYGVALLNDCVNGYACKGNVLQLSLLRGPTYPDAHSDQGHHTIAFAVQPHRGAFAESSVVVAARLFNSPMHLKKDGPSIAPTLKGLQIKLTGARNVILNTIKRGEDDHFSSAKAKKTVILRLYEAYGGHAVPTLVTSLPVASATIVDVLERELSTLKISSNGDGGEVTAALPRMHAFEILTIKLTLA